VDRDDAPLFRHSVGALIAVDGRAQLVAGRAPDRCSAAPVWRAWTTATLVWVCLQGAFGALTVTRKLQPVIVTLHLLGGIGLLALLAAQAEAMQRRVLALPRPVVHATAGVLLLVFLQIALGGWVSSNYAVLACRDFPTCQGSWWPPADFVEGFRLDRQLGRAADGGYLGFRR
jgi:cytochrome c oxidase assembly protein subunit 15